MAENHYTEILNKLGEQSERLVRLETISTQTLEQVRKTNGRVNVLEDKVDSLELTRAENKGSWKTAGAFATTLSTALYFLLNKFIK